MHDIVNCLPPHRDPGLHIQRDTLILLDLGYRRAEHVDEGNRLIPAPGYVVTGEHEQVLRVTAHPGGKVVHLEQAGQPLGVLLAELKVIDEMDLAFDE